MDPLPPPTRRPLHGYKYTPAQQAEKDYHLKQLRRDWPDVNLLWQEWVYDFCANTPQEELDRLMESGELDERDTKISSCKMEKLCEEWNHSSAQETSSLTPVQM